MKQRKAPQRPWGRNAPQELAAGHQAILAIAGEDTRCGFWALELLERRKAVARWRGQTGSSIREVIQAVNRLPA
jgi:hypothetical protein